MTVEHLYQGIDVALQRPADQLRIRIHSPPRLTPRSQPDIANQPPKRSGSNASPPAAAPARRPVGSAVSTHAWTGRRAPADSVLGPGPATVVPPGTRARLPSASEAETRCDWSASLPAVSSRV